MKKLRLDMVKGDPLVSTRGKPKHPLYSGEKVSLPSKGVNKGMPSIGGRYLQQAVDGGLARCIFREGSMLKKGVLMVQRIISFLTKMKTQKLLTGCQFCFEL